jgi:hypothetical protein
MNILIIYPHGLGDCLMLTPSLREWYKKNNTKVNIAIMKRFESSKIFANNPYVDKIFYVQDPWNDYSSADIGFIEVQKAGEIIATQNNLISIFLNQPPPIHKIFKNAGLLGLTLESTHIDIFISEEERNIANEVIDKYVGLNQFGFIQTTTGAGSTKDLPNGFGEKWLRNERGLNYFIEIGKTFKFDEYNINIQFEILRRASAVCIPDSVFYHACSGLNKNIDFVYFGRGVDVYNRVRNLNNNIIENVNYSIPNI